MLEYVLRLAMIVHTLAWFLFGLMVDMSWIYRWNINGNLLSALIVYLLDTLLAPAHYQGWRRKFTGIPRKTKFKEIVWSLQITKRRLAIKKVLELVELKFQSITHIQVRRCFSLIYLCRQMRMAWVMRVCHKSPNTTEKWYTRRARKSGKKGELSSVMEGACTSSTDPSVLWKP